MKPIIVTIDGPAGAGKSTVAKAVAQQLGPDWTYLDTGAMYRAITWKASQEDLITFVDGWCDIPAIVEMIRRTDLRLENGKVYCDDLDVTLEIRRPEISAGLKPIADSPECRAELVKMQQIIGTRGHLVTEGRDQGSVVFPDADIKYYFDATVEERAKRRQKADGGDPEVVRAAVEARDSADKSRPVGRLVIPDGAVVIDTTKYTVEELTSRLLKTIVAYGSWPEAEIAPSCCQSGHCCEEPGCCQNG